MRNPLRSLAPTVAVALAAGLAVSAWAGGAAARTYGVVVGIDDYVVINDLDGAVNDARDIARALESRGADVMLITDAAATRSAIVEALRTQIAKARSGDAVVFTYAGHGVQIDEALIGDEADGRDENFALHAFAPSGPGAAERLRDNDIALLLSAAAPGVSVLFVADSCHSGTMTRAPVPGGALGKTRAADLFIGSIDDDPLPPPDEASFQAEANDFPYVVFAAAARDEEQTPEVTIDGDKRGALSWSIARAIEGQADGGDGDTSLADLREFVRAQVRAFSGARQTPDVEFATENLEGIRRLLNGDQAAERETDAAPDEPLQPGPAPRLAVIGGLEEAEQAALADIAELVENVVEAEIVWDRPVGRLIDRLSADMLAEATTADHVAAAIRKWRVVAGLARWSPRRAFDLRVSNGDRVHTEGEKVSFEAFAPEAGPEIGKLTLFNLASGGEVQYVYPPESAVAKTADAIFRGTTFKLGPAVVTPPFGADHMIGVVTAAGADEMRTALRDLDGQAAPEEAMRILAEYAADPAMSRVAVLPLFSGRIGE